MPTRSSPAPAATAAARPTSHWPCLCARGSGISLQLSVVPNARNTRVDGLQDGALRVRLAAPPIDGRANEALVAWLARELDVPRRAVDVALGASGRRKRVDVDVPLAQAEAWLARVLGPDSATRQ